MESERELIVMPLKITSKPLLSSKTFPYLSYVVIGRFFSLEVRRQILKSVYS